MIVPSLSFVVITQIDFYIEVVKKQFASWKRQRCQLLHAKYEAEICLEDRM
jgi:hypothetical protein